MNRHHRRHAVRHILQVFRQPVPLTRGNLPQHLLVPLRIHLAAVKRDVVDIADIERIIGRPEQLLKLAPRIRLLHQHLMIANTIPHGHFQSADQFDVPLPFPSLQRDITTHPAESGQRVHVVDFIDRRLEAAERLIGTSVAQVDIGEVQRLIRVVGSPLVKREDGALRRRHHRGLVETIRPEPLRHGHENEGAAIRSDGQPEFSRRIRARDTKAVGNANARERLVAGDNVTSNFSRLNFRCQGAPPRWRRRHQSNRGRSL